MMTSEGDIDVELNNGGAKKRDRSEMSPEDSPITPPSKEGRPTSDTDILQRMLDGALVKLYRRIEKQESQILVMDRQLVFLTGENRRLGLLLDEYEQYSRGTSIRIYGIAEEKPAKKGDPPEKTEKLVVEKLNKELPELKVTENDIGIAHRVGMSHKGNPRAILCQFKGKKTKWSAIDEIKKKAKANKGKRLAINVVEDLTPIRASLAREARQAVKNKQLLGTWSSGGKIKVRDLNRDIHELKTRWDLDRLLNVEEVGEDTEETTANQEEGEPMERADLQPAQEAKEKAVDTDTASPGSRTATPATVSYAAVVTTALASATPTVTTTTTTSAHKASTGSSPTSPLLDNNLPQSSQVKLLPPGPITTPVMIPNTRLSQDCRQDRGPPRDQAPRPHPSGAGQSPRQPRDQRQDFGPRGPATRGVGQPHRFSNPRQDTLDSMFRGPRPSNPLPGMMPDNRPLAVRMNFRQPPPIFS